MQDITPNNNQGATSTNTMNPRTLSAASAGSITPTIITQSNADRRRRAAAREARRQENLAANVERAEIDREYKRLRDAEDAANKRAEARKESAKREKIAIYEGGINSPLNIRHTSVGEYLGDNLKGAAEPIKVPEELRQLATMDTGGEAANAAAAYIGLDKFRDAVNDLLKREAEEKAMIQRTKDFATLSGSSYNSSASAAASYTPMTEDARIAHQRLIESPGTSSEMKAQLTADLKRDAEYAQTHGVQLSAAEEKHLSEIYRGGSSVSKEQKAIAAAYLSAAGSTYGKEDFNRAQSNVYVNQTEKARDALLRRYQGNSEINNPNNSAATTAALRANMAGAAEVLSDLTESRRRLGLENAEKKRLSAAVEREYAKQDAKVKAAMKDNPYVRDEDTAKYAESILRVVGDDRVNLSNDAFLREQALTERKFGGTQWTSAGGESAEDAVAKGKDRSSYSAFKSAGEDDNEFILIDSAGKKRYTLKQDNSGAFKIFGWSGDIVASSETAQGLPSALKNLNVPFDEKTFNVFNPDSDSSVVKLSEETDISDIDTAATFKASVLGTMRTNEEIMKAETARREAAEAVTRQAALSDLDKTLTDSQGYTLRIMGEGVDMPKAAATEPKKNEQSILPGVVMVAGMMSGSLPLTMAAKGAYDLFTNPPKTILDEWTAEDAVTESAMRVDALTYGGRVGEKDVGGLFGSAREYADVVDSLVESGELVAGSKEKSLLLPDDDNPDNSVYTYTDLEWSDKASKESVEKFFNAESKLKSAGEGLSAAISDYNAKVESKEKTSRDVWWGIPQTARDLTHKYLPEAEKVYPYVNAAELFKSDLRKKLIVGEFVRDAISGKMRYENTSDFIQKEVYDADPLLSWAYDYRYFRDEPVNYGIMVGAGYAAPYALTGGAKAIGKAMPHVRGTVIDPISNTKLAQKSSKYVSDVMKSIPPSPVSVRVGSANLLFNADKGLGGQVDSLMFIRRTGNYETATPIVSRLKYKEGNEFTRTRYFFGLNDNTIHPSNLAFGEEYILREPEKTAFAKAALENVGDTRSLERLHYRELQTKYLQNTEPIVMQDMHPIIREIVQSRGFKKVDDVTDAIVDTMSEHKVFSQSSLTQRVIGDELGDAGLGRTPHDIDLFAEYAEVFNFNDEVVKAINKVEGYEAVYVDNGKVFIKSDNSELFDTHVMGSKGSDSPFAPGGERMERYNVGNTNIQSTSLQTQFYNKRSGTQVLLPEPKIFEGTEAFDKGGFGVGYLMPRHAGRVKDLTDYYFAGRVLANQMKLKNYKYADEFRNVLEKDIETYGEETAKRLRSEYETEIKELQKAGVKMTEFNGEIIPVKDTAYLVRKSSKNLNPKNLEEKTFKNKGVEDSIKWISNTDNLIGTPIGLFFTAGFASSAAAKFAEGEDSSREFVSREVVPMLVGGYFGGRGVQSLAKQLAFRGRTNYIPLEKLTYKYVIEGLEDYPLYKYENTLENRMDFVKRYSRGGEAMQRAEDAFGVTTDAEYFAYRAMNQEPIEVRPDVLKIDSTRYIHEDISDKFSGSVGSVLSPKFSRALEEEIYDSVSLPFGLNMFPKQYKRPSGFLVLGKKPVADVRHGLGTTRTAEYIEKNVSPDQYQSVSGKTAKYANVVAEDENTIQPGAEMQIINKSYYTKWEGKPIAMDVVGMIPKGAKKTDVNAIFEPKKYQERTPQEEYDSLDFENMVKNTALIATSEKIDVSTWYPVLNARLKHYKSQFEKVAKTNKSKDINEKLSRLDVLQTKINHLVNIKRGRPKISTRGRGGNPFTANAILPNTKTGEYSKMSQIPTTTERKTPNIFTRESKPQSTGTAKSKSGGGVESLFTKTSAKTTGIPESKPTTRNTGAFSFGTSTTPSYTTTKSTSAKTETSLFSSGSTRSTGRSGSSISRPSRSNSRAKSSGSKVSYSKPLKVFEPIPRRNAKIRLDKNKDKRKELFYDMFTVENVDLPILRGEEALTGKPVTKRELPRNKKTLYQFGNIFTTKKPSGFKKPNKKGFRI